MKAIAIIFIIVGLWINYKISPKIEYITVDNKQYVVSVEGKETYRPLTDTDCQEGILYEVSPKEPK